MARARNIKPGFFTNDVLGEQDPLGRLLFAGMWCHADREGRLLDRPKKLKAEILPYDNCDVDGLIQCLHCAKLVLRYVIDGIGYIQIINFKKHQNPHVKEGPSLIPDPPPPDVKTVQAPDENSTNPADSLNLIPDSLNPDPGSLIPDSLIPDTGGKSKATSRKKQVPTLPEWIPPESWAGFIAMRVKIKAPLTDMAVTLAIGKLEKLKASGQDVRAVLEQSIERSWRGLFEVKSNDWPLRSGPNRQESLENRNMQVVDEWLQENRPPISLEPEEEP